VHADSGQLTGDLTGTGTSSLTTSDTDFGTVNVGAFVTRTIVFTNQSSTASGALPVQLSGANSNQFSMVTNGCAGVSVPAGGTCSVEVAFVPTGTAGGRAATLTVGLAPPNQAQSAMVGNAAVVP
ncbi:MAG: choice-of-anchor D domain-containing protein, partial [Candidatus Eisenbacteria bacterium]